MYNGCQYEISVLSLCYDFSDLGAIVVTLARCCAAEALMDAEVRSLAAAGGTVAAKPGLSAPSLRNGDARLDELLVSRRRWRS